MHLPKAMTRRLSPSKLGIFSIVGGTAAAQVFGLCTMPLLSRLYSPGDFGVYAVLSALVVTFGTVGALRFELAIPLPSRERDAHSLASAGLWAALALALVGTVGVAVGGDRLSAAFNQPNLMPWLWIVPASGALMSSCLVLNQLAIRQRRFGSVGRRYLAQSVSMVLTQLATGGAGIKPGGLILGLGLSQIFGAVSLTHGAGLRSQEAYEGRNFTRLRAVVSRYRRFPILLAPSGLLNVLGLQLPIILIAYWYGSQVVGWLGLAQRVLAVPVTLLGTAIAQVYLAELSRAVRGDLIRARQLFMRGTRTLVPVAAVLLLALILSGPWVFSWVFGEEWRQSGEYARALSVGLAAQMVGSPLSQTLIVLERQGLQFTWDAFRVVLISGAVVAAAWAEASPLTAIWLVGGLSAAFYCLSWYLSYRCLTKSIGHRDRTRGDGDAGSQAEPGSAI